MYPTQNQVTPSVHRFEVVVLTVATQFFGVWASFKKLGIDICEFFEKSLFT